MRAPDRLSRWLTLCLLLLLTAAAPACAPEEDDGGRGPIRLDDGSTPTTGGGVSLVDMQVFTDGDGRFFTPLAHMMGKPLGDQDLSLISSIVLSNTSGRERAVIVEAQLDGYATPTRQRVVVPARGMATIDAMTPTFDFQALYAITSAPTASLTVTVLDGDDVADLRTHTLTLDPVNRMRWAVEEDGAVIDLRPFAAVMVTPEDREHSVQRLLTDAAAHSQYGAILGYQTGSAEGTADQARAVYNALKARGIVYTSVAGSFFDQSQYVKLPAQSLATGSANCIDGALVFASAFEAMSMDPVLVFMSGHAFVGVRALPGAEDIFYIETTMVGSHTFEEAVAEGQRKVEHIIATQDPNQMLLDIKQARAVGITPLNL